MAALPLFTPGFRLIDGSQLNAALQNVGTQIETIPISALAGLANGQVRKMAITGAFRITSVGFRVGTPASTAAKAATLTAQINGVAMTGGVISLTTANCNTSGALVASTAITGKNTGDTTTLEFAVSAVTPFVEGDGWIEVTIVKV